MAGATATAAGWAWWHTRDQYGIVRHPYVEDRLRYSPVLAHCYAEGYPWPDNDELDGRDRHDP